MCFCGSFVSPKTRKQKPTWALCTDQIPFAFAVTPGHAAYEQLTVFRRLRCPCSSTTASEAQSPLKLSPSSSYRLNQSIALTRRSHALYTIDQIQRRDLPIITKEQLRPFPSIERLSAAISEVHCRVERFLQLERPRPGQIAGKHMRADPRVLLIAFSDVDHPVCEGVPVPTLVPPYEWVFCPRGRIVRSVPGCGKDLGVWAVVVRCGEDFEVLSNKDRFPCQIIRSPQWFRSGVGAIDEDFKR